MKEHITDIECKIITEINPQVILNFADFPGGLEAVPQGTVMYIKARVEDKVGLWSGIAVSAPITIDKTAATVTELELANHYISSANTIYGISFDLADTESGILEYRSIVVPDNQPGTVAALENDPAKWKITNTNQAANNLAIASYATPAHYTLNLDDRCYVAVKVRNKAGIWSAPAFTDEIIIDYETPRITLYQGTNGVKKAAEFVFNSTPFSFGYSTADAVSPDVEVSLNLYYEAGTPVLDVDGEPLELAGVWKATEILNLISYPFEETAYQTYTLRARIEDRAGNSTELDEKLRVNSPPTVTFENFFDTTSLKPLVLGAIIDDPDDMERNFQYHWELPDYPHAYPGFETVKYQAAPEIRVQHATPQSQVSQYRLQLVVTDSDGKASAPFETVILVLNTAAGSLYDHEYWNPQAAEGFKIRGDVVVPAGLSLTIAGGAVIEAAADFQTGGYSLVVEGSLEMEANSELRIEYDAPGEYWKGIYAADNSNVMLDNAKVSNAERGVTVNRLAQVSLNFTEFNRNKVGIHVLKNGQQITGCILRDSYYYGIKEEMGAVPVLAGCVFTGNFIDYYDNEDTAVEVDELIATGRN